MHTLSDVGEFGLIDRIKAIVGTDGVAVGIGDDTAAIDRGGSTYLLATVDMLVENVHFRRHEVDAVVLGRRAIGVNLSDIAAVGGSPNAALVSLGLQPDLPLDFVEALYRGMKQEADRFGVVIAGGNVARIDGPIVIDVTVLGEVLREDIVLRRGAQPGDVLAVTGVLGEAAARHLESLPNLAPEPRIEAGRALASGHLAHAMVDLSDGLGSDVHHLARESDVGVVLEERLIPVSIAARRAAERAGQNPLDLALFGGEDYELLVALPEDSVEAAAAALGDVPLTVVGTVLHPDQGVLLEHSGGTRQSLEPRGWSHF